MKTPIVFIFVAGFLAACAPAQAQGRAGPPPNPQGLGPGAPLRLSLKQATQIALAPEGSTRVKLAEELVRQAQSQSSQARAALLPNLDAAVTQQNQTRNLEAYGIGLQFPSTPLFTFPKFVGPFSTFDARVTARQSVFDLSSIRRFQASRAGLELARAEQTDAQEQVLGDVARAYLAALESEAGVKAATANVELAEALVALASNQKEAGAGTGIEVTRARVQLANERQRLLVAQNERARAQLQLLRVIGLDLETELELTDEMAYVAAQPLTFQQALALALESRPDWMAQQKRLEAARLNYSSVKMELLPSVGIFGDYGASGLGINDSLPTRTYGFTVKIPVYDGGGRDARRAQSSSQLRQEEIRRDDLRAQIELEVRLALDNLRSAEDQVHAAEEGLALAENELAQARRRYQAGVAYGLEVTDAQTRLERARDNRISALYNYNLARIQQALATGTIRQFIQ
jgi:outer membrane protein TolC